MKPYGPRDVYRFANTVFPDNSELALFNLVTEIMTGQLTCVVLEGDPTVVEDSETSLACVYGLVMLNGVSPCRITWRFKMSEDEDLEPHVKTLQRLAFGGAASLTHPHLVGMKWPPHTPATLAACRGKNGAYAYALYHHADFTVEQAMYMLRGIAEKSAAEETSRKN